MSSVFVALLPSMTGALRLGTPIEATGASEPSRLGPPIRADTASSISISVPESGSWANRGSRWSLRDRVQDEMDAAALTFVCAILLHQKF
jgi:hypothetical protein